MRRSRLACRNDSLFGKEDEKCVRRDAERCARDGRAPQTTTSQGEPRNLSIEQDDL